MKGADNDNSPDSGDSDYDFSRPKFRSVTLESDEPWQPAIFRIDDDTAENKGAGGAERIAETRKRLELDCKGKGSSLKPMSSALHSWWQSKQEL